MAEKMSTGWCTINQHLQSVGTATCDVSHLILQADILLDEEKNSRGAFMLMTAARDVLHHRKLARRSRAALVGEKPKKRMSAQIKKIETKRAPKMILVNFTLRKIAEGDPPAGVKAS